MVPTWHFRAIPKPIMAIALICLGELRCSYRHNIGGHLSLYATGARHCFHIARSYPQKEEPVSKFLRKLWSDDEGQDIAEYAVMLAVILVIVVGTIRLIGTNANTVFSQVGSSIP